MDQRRWNLPYPSARERRVVITGLGAVSAAGVGVEPLWQALLAGRSCISTIERYPVSDMNSRIGGEVKDFDPIMMIPQRLKPKRISRQGQFAVVATDEAVKDAGLTTASLRGRKCALVLGSSNCNSGEISEATIKVENRGPSYINPAAVSLCSMQTHMSAVISMLELENVPSLVVAGACTAGIDAVVIGSEMILSGKADVVICGGTDAPLTRTFASAFIQAGMCSTRNDEPQAASRPFDRERDNGLLAEGAGVVILERMDEALERGARPYAEWLGNHACTDATGGIAGNGLGAAMRTALHNSRCRATDIDFVSAWGCGDPMIDRVETQAIKEVFGERAYDIAVNSIKAVTGNPLAAAGVLQLISIALSLRHQMLPPTANYEHGDIDCDLDYIQGKPRRARPRRVMLNAHGQGGGNTCAVLAPVAAE